MVKRSKPGHRRKQARRGTSSRSRALRWFIDFPWTLQAVAVAIVLGLSWFAANGVYQVLRKPTELFFPVSGVLHKRPAETWDTYAPLFRRHATPLITPEFLAALAQVEASGNPVVRTYWRFRWSARPFEIYRPASSAVGMYQFTDGTFAEARRYCIRDGRVVEDGPWHDFDSCWFNSLYFRVVPSHAVELTSAYLHARVTRALARAGIRSASPHLQRELAALIHLCGAGAGEAHARRGLIVPAGYRCGDHDPRDYLARVRRHEQYFAGRSREPR